LLKAVYPAKISAVDEALDFIEGALMQYEHDSKSVHEAMLIFEECMVRLIQHSPEDGTVHVHIKKRGGLAYISLSAPGTEFQSVSLESDFGFEGGSYDMEQEASIRGMLIQAAQSKLRYVRKEKYNLIEITVGSPKKVLAWRTVWSLLAAVLIGYILRFALSPAAQSTIDTYVLIPIQTLFINFLTFVSAPAIFFSIIVAVSNYTSFSDPGKVGLKVVLGYAATSVLAIIIGVGTFLLIRPGTEGQLAGFVARTGLISQTDFLGTVSGIIPSNIISPFLEGNTLQLIFAAIIFGVALGHLGDYAGTMRTIFEALNTLFSKVIEILAKCVPVAGFAAAVSCIFNVEPQVLLSLVEMFGTLLIGLAAIGLVYLFIVWLLGKVSPAMFFRKSLPIMHETLMEGGGVSSIAKTIRFCKYSMGISPKISAFSIPYGAIANVDGSCIYLAVSVLFLARLCGVEIFGTGLIPVMLTVFILSLGSPISPGTVNVCLVVLMGQMGVSIAAIGLIMGINSIVEMFLSASNVVGDVAVSLAVASSEDMLDKEVFNSTPRKR